MWIFAGLVFVGCVLWYWLRKAARALLAIGGILELTVNRAAKLRGDPPVTSAEEAESIFR